MRVILLENIPKLGKKWDVKSVTPGFARNYLIPRKLVKIANKKSMDDLARQKEIEAAKSEEELKQIQALASQMDGLEVTIPVKASGDGTIFGAVNAAVIAEALGKLGFKIAKDQIVLEESIKELGEYPVAIRFEHNLETDIKVIVVGERT